MDAVIARVLEMLAADVVDAVRAHESYKQLVKNMAEQALANVTTGQQGQAPAA